ncbi:MAG: GNAT family N-acetyltransferase [Planctomycetota bacterium]|jgi:nucleoside-diphosphate-sugar epimerase
MRYVILGSGYTGQRVARLLRAEGHDVVETTRAEPAASCEGARVLYSFPPPVVVDTRGALRVVYISSTGVYGDAVDVDADTPPAPATDRQRARHAAEVAIAPDLVLRAAGIYGPGRGVHAMLLAGRYRFAGDGSNFVSRIHVDDLAAICRAALDSDLLGAFPVADDRPSTAREVATFAADVLGLELPGPGAVHETLRTTRRVDGRAVRAALQVDLAYPTYREGLDASWIDGVLVRAVRPDDRELLAEAFAQLSDASRYLRFHGAKHELSEAELDYFTRLDGVDRIAYAAFDSDGNGMGGAGLVRVADDVAEFAVTILDRHQGLGLGTLLLRRLCVAAREAGIARVQVEVLPGNRAARALVERVAPDAARRGEQGVIVYEFPLG